MNTTCVCKIFVCAIKPKCIKILSAYEIVHLNLLVEFFFTVCINTPNFLHTQLSHFTLVGRNFVLSLFFSSSYHSITMYPSTFETWLQAKFHNEEIVTWLQAKLHNY